MPGTVLGAGDAVETGFQPKCPRQWFSKCGPGTSSLSATGEPVKNAGLIRNSQDAAQCFVLQQGLSEALRCADVWEVLSSCHALQGVGAQCTGVGHSGTSSSKQDSGVPAPSPSSLLQVHKAPDGTWKAMENPERSQAEQR